MNEHPPFKKCRCTCGCSRLFSGRDIEKRVLCSVCDEAQGGDNGCGHPDEGTCTGWPEIHIRDTHLRADPRCNDFVPKEIK